MKIIRLHNHHTQAYRRVPAVIAVFAVAAVYAFLAFGMAGATELPLPTFQSSPLPGPTPEAWIPASYSYLPIIMLDAFQATYTPPDVPVVLTCQDDQCRGDFYRSLVSNTITIMNPLAGWASSGCSCGLLDARARGWAVGTILGMGVKIVGSVFTTIGNVIGQAVSFLVQIITLISAPPETLSVSCEAEMELFCFGLAAVVALDDVAGGFVMTMTLFVVAVASIYLILWIIKEVREIMQPGGGDE